MNILVFKILIYCIEVRGFDPPFIHSISSALKGIENHPAMQILPISSTGSPSAVSRTGALRARLGGPLFTSWSRNPEREVHLSYLSVRFPTATICRGTKSSCFCKNKQIAVTLQIARQAGRSRGEKKPPGFQGGCGCGKWRKTWFSQQYQCLVSIQRETRTFK